MKQDMINEDEISIRCSCGQRLMDMNRYSTTSLSIKCPRCRAVMVVTMKNQKYNCMPQRIGAYRHAFGNR